MEPFEAQGTQEELEVEEFENDEDEDIFDDLDDLDDEDDDESDDEAEGEPIPPEGMKVTAKKNVKLEGGKKESRTATVLWHPGDNLEDAVERYGAETVYTHYLRNAKIKLQGVMRSFLENGVTEDKIRAELEGWRPDEDRSPSKDPLSRIMGDWNKLDDEERQRVKEMLGIS